MFASDAGKFIKKNPGESRGAKMMIRIKNIKTGEIKEVEAHIAADLVMQPSSDWLMMTQSTPLLTKNDADKILERIENH